MKKPINSDGVLPTMMGTEHELSLTFTSRFRVEDFQIDDIEFDKTIFTAYGKEDNRAENFYENIKENIALDLDICAPSIKVLNNGGVASSIRSRPVEVATPECHSPKQLVAYSIASRLLVKKWLTDYLQENSSDLRSVAINERVIDSHGNSWGEHDNFSLLPEESGMGVVQADTPSAIWLHLLTRGVVTGAGSIRGIGVNCWSTSQKLPTVTSIYDKKWGSTAMWGDDERLEIRCSDKNISEWAHLIRIGSAALVLALTRTGFTIGDIGISTEQLYVEKAGEFDSLKVDSRGNIKLSYEAKIAASVQRVLAEASLELLDVYDQSASEYAFIAKEWLAYAERLEKEGQKEEPIDLTKFLEADWAGKFYGIQNKIKKDLEIGASRLPYDYTAKAQDILYDRVLLDSPIAGEKIYTSEGTGFKLNNRIKNRQLIKKPDIEHAIDNAPQYSRAQARNTFMKFLKENNCLITSFDWASISWVDTDGEDHERHF